MKAIRILVADDEAMVREGFVELISYQSDMKVVGQAKNAAEVVEFARQNKPDIILLDLHMPKEYDGVNAIPEIKKVSPDSSILILTSFDSTPEVYQSIKAGAMGFLLKGMTRTELLAAIHDLAKGKSFIPPFIAMKVIKDMEHPAEEVYTADPLTPREHDTLELLSHGNSNREIAATLFVHERTVAKYVSSILSKLHLANRTQAALFARKEKKEDNKK
jgi:NarL family two-component system response regulator LiaR